MRIPEKDTTIMQLCKVDSMKAFVRGFTKAHYCNSWSYYTIRKRMGGESEQYGKREDKDSERMEGR